MVGISSTAHTLWNELLNLITLSKLKLAEGSTRGKSSRQAEGIFPATMFTSWLCSLLNTHNSVLPARLQVPTLTTTQILNHVSLLKESLHIEREYRESQQ